MEDGSIVLVEIERQTVTRVAPDGRTEVIAHTGGGPNGLAVGPDGAFYVCNNGGFAWRLEHEPAAPGRCPRSDYTGGLIERVDPKTGAVTVLYDHCGATQAARPERHRLRRAGRVLFHRPRQGAGARPRLGRRLLRAGRRLEDRRGRPSDPDAERHRPVAGRQDALRRRDRDRAALGVRRAGAGRAGQGAVPLAAWRPADGGPGRLPALRQPGGGRRAAMSAWRRWSTAPSA